MPHFKLAPTKSTTGKRKRSDSQSGAPPSKKRTPLPNNDEKSDEEDEPVKKDPKTYPCHAENCNQVFNDRAARAAHARNHENDADQEHLAAYFYCTANNCDFARPCFDDTNFRGTRLPGLHRKGEMATHLIRVIAHAQLSAAQRSEEKAIIIMRTRMARQHTGLSEIPADQTPIPPHRAGVLPPPLP